MPLPLSIGAMPAHDSRVYTLGHSPDPDDAFMFYAMAERRIDLHGLEFEHRLEDIQTLNERATRGELDISAISIHAYAYVADKYALLPCGASMGDGYGPLLVAANPKDLSPTASPTECRDWLRGRKIAVPGEMTSAFLALRLYLDEFEHIVVPFDRIFDSVSAGEAEAGLIIHEGQLTYSSSGFRKIVDLGDWWKRDTGLPLPLGGNVLRKDIGSPEREAISLVIRQSIEFGLTHREEAVRHALPYARDMTTDLAGKFIGMYVNDYTRDYGDTGRMAIREFLNAGVSRGYITRPVELEFVS